MKTLKYLSLILLPGILQANNFFDCNSNLQNVSYIYAPGFLSTEASMVKYCPRFTSWTGQTFEAKNGGHIISQPHTCVIFPETQYNINAKSILDYKLNLSESDLGQTKDIECVNNTYNNHLKGFENHNIIMHGHSRGAVAVFNFIAEYKPSNVKAVILEGIFDDMKHVIKHFAQNKRSVFENLLNQTLKFFIGNYHNDLIAKNYAEKLAIDIPILFVTSLKDTIACTQGVINLYLILKKRGFKKVHLLILDNACHSSYMTNNIKDKEKYQSCVHAFYKNYDLPYNKLKAELGKIVFDQTQPEIIELAKYKLPLCCDCLLHKR